MQTLSLSFYWSDELEAAIKERSTEPFEIGFGCDGEDYRVFAKAVNQGIDSHLEAIMLTQNGNKFTITPDTLHVLVRRLMEMDDETADSFASSICQSLDIELI